MFGGSDVIQLTSAHGLVLNEVLKQFLSTSVASNLMMIL
jgi:hypothetical protein